MNSAELSWVEIESRQRWLSQSCDESAPAHKLSAIHPQLGSCVLRGFRPNACDTPTEGCAALADHFALVYARLLLFAPDFVALAACWAGRLDQVEWGGQLR